VHAQSVARVRRSFSLGDLGAGAGCSAQAATDAVRRGGDRYRRLHGGCDRAEISDGSTVSTGHLRLLLLLLLLLLFGVFQSGEEPRAPSVMQSSI